VEDTTTLIETAATATGDIWPDEYRRARELVGTGCNHEAECTYRLILGESQSPMVRATVCNDLAALAAMAGDVDQARQLLEEALAMDPQCQAALENRNALKTLDGELNGHIDHRARRSQSAARAPILLEKPLRMAVLSLLFNWPSSGGGNLHTVGLVRALAKEGHDVRHIFARKLDFKLGRCDETCPISSTVLEFENAEWRADVIQQRFRKAVDAVAPDVVLITDAWNFKPLLAEAIQGYPYILRFDAFECLCPLDNIRLLPSEGSFRQCYRNQLATPGDCCRCVEELGHWSGPLHTIERELSRFGDPGYHGRLLASLRQAFAVLAVNPVVATLLEPYADLVLTVPSGIDAERFPAGGKKPNTSDVTTVLFAGSSDDPIKGFDVLHEACARLWQRRQDFRLVVTDDPPEMQDEFTSFVGWQAQAGIVRQFYSADMVVIPSICQEAMPLVAMEAMGASCPVIASRLGGLPFSVVEGTTGLLFEPGDPQDLALQIAALLDKPDRRIEMGAAGRRRFEEFFTWDAVMGRHYRPLLQELAKSIERVQ
jgi:glycosyltransferase involved in cell wall biosynthesis